MLEHQHAIGRGDRHRSPRSALADNRRDDRDPDVEALLGRPCDGLRLPTLFRLDPRECARRVDQSDDRDPEAVGELHQPDRLAVALRLGHPEIVLEP